MAVSEAAIGLTYYLIKRFTQPEVLKMMRAVFPRPSRLLNILIITTILTLTAPLTQAATYSGGTGTPDNPYLIATPQDLNTIGLNETDWDKHFKMTADIDIGEFTGEQFNIVGDFSRPFTGIFDGNGYILKKFNWSLASSYGDCIGLFGVVEEPSIIRNITMTEVDINALPSSDFVGSLAGYNYGGSILDCSVSGNILGSGNVGGLIGYNDGGNIFGCHSAVSVSGTRYGVGGLIGIELSGAEVAFCSATGNISGQDDYVGGLIGSASDTHIYNCFATGDVISTGSRYSTGGLVGDAVSCAVENCYARGDVTGISYVGGLFGYYVSSNTRIVNSYASGTVSGNNSVGGFIGYGNYSQIFQGCFWSSDTNPDLDGIGNDSDPNVIGLTTTEMQTATTYLNAGWDFSTPVWVIDEGVNYPQLWWEIPTAPADLAIELSDSIAAMTLQAGTANSLQTKLDSALKLLEDENEKNNIAAINSLQAFINSVNAQSGKKIPTADADTLIAQAQQIIEMLTTE